MTYFTSTQSICMLAFPTRQLKSGKKKAAVKRHEKARCRTSKAGIEVMQGWNVTSVDLMLITSNQFGTGVNASIFPLRVGERGARKTNSWKRVGPKPTSPSCFTGALSIAALPATREVPCSRLCR